MIPGPKILLLGDSGTGKTYSLKTLITAGITPFVIFTEPGMETIGDLPDGKWHWTYTKPATQDWATLLETQTSINKWSYDALTKMQDSRRQEYTGLLDFLRQCNNFKCDCHGQAWGDVGTWGTDRALVVDSLSGLSDMAMFNTVGGKPTKAQNEWGIAMGSIKMILTKLTTDTKCTFVLISHIARERDEISGGMINTVNTLGNKLAPDIPRMFSDVIQSIRVGSEFTWDTAAGNVAVKTRNLAIQSKLPPSFVPLIEGWKRKGGAIRAATNQAVA